MKQLFTIVLIFCLIPAFSQSVEIDSLKIIKHRIESRISTYQDSLSMIERRIKLLESEERLAANKLSGKVESIPITIKKEVKIYDEPMRIGNVLAKFKNGEIVELVAFDGNWCLLKRGELTGWAYKFDLHRTENFETFEFIYRERLNEAEDAFRKKEIEVRWQELEAEGELLVVYSNKQVDVRRVRTTKGYVIHTTEPNEKFGIYNYDAEYIWVKWMDQNDFKLSTGYVLKTEMPESESIVQAIEKIEQEKELQKQRADLTKQKKIQEEEIAKKNAEKARLERLAEEKKQKEARRQQLITKYGSVIAERIIARKIWIGMTKQQLIESWGRPYDINRSVYSFGIHEQWIYSSTYVYLEDDLVTSWQD